MFLDLSFVCQIISINLKLNSSNIDYCYINDIEMFIAPKLDFEIGHTFSGHLVYFLLFLFIAVCTLVS